MVNKDHKDRLFTFMFGREENKAWILSLYNAVNGSDYSDADAVEITTIDDTVYMGMKNDASFLLHWTMNLWAHQSTYNPNMPVRELMYLGKIYDKYIHQRRAHIYGSKLIPLPVPKLVVFYNGRDDKEDDSILKLSDAFPDDAGGVEPDVEVRVRMLNINQDHNRQLMDACKPLSEYAWFVQKIRDHLESHVIEEAVDMAVDEMPDDFQIRDFLIGNRAEVKNMCLTEYNEEETMQMFKEEGVEEGKKQGIAEGKKQGIAEGKKQGIAEGKKQGEDKLARLIKELLSANRVDDISAATDDQTKREAFYREFNIA